MSAKEQAKGFGGAIIRLLIWFGIMGLIAVLGYWASSNASQLRGTDFTDLDPLVKEQKELPQNEFGQLTVSYVLGPYASGSKSINTWGIDMKSGESQYYQLILPDFSVITAKVSDKEEIAELDALSDQFWAYLEDDDKDMDSLPDYILKGKVSRLKESNLIQYYDESWDAMDMDEALVFRKSDILIDATAMPVGTQFLIYVLPVILLCVGVCIFCILRRRKAKMAAAAAPPLSQTSSEQADPWSYENGHGPRGTEQGPADFAQTTDYFSSNSYGLVEEGNEADEWKRSQSEESYSRDGLDL